MSRRPRLACSGCVPPALTLAMLTRDERATVLLATVRALRAGVRPRKLTQAMVAAIRAPGEGAIHQVRATSRRCKPPSIED